MKKGYRRQVLSGLVGFSELKVREVFDESQLEQLGQELESAKGTAHRKAG